ncbi:hypothetical protein Rhopal_006009-T1 [Rhodotorula paludigena]|uniref:Uncharacterized protein n=1 Tax=Rhodotorula paludigena TaxID=86838 RepID=A0AAV5GR07_9BASI|nr:hypothetical protein Rhopal_006009-T1 [Rhodotorula paludigena]
MLLSTLLACALSLPALAQTAGNATATATSLLPVPSYGTRTEDAFATATASALASSLPGYTYNLTQETTSYCATARCTSDAANVTVNFCNPTTMGWNCECNNKAESRLQPLFVPVNTYDCRLRTAACLDQCQNPSASPPVSNAQACRQACNYILGSTCGTANQVLPEYQVDKYDDKPKYYAE